MTSTLVVDTCMGARWITAIFIILPATTPIAACNLLLSVDSVDTQPMHNLNAIQQPARRTAGSYRGPF